MTPPTIDIREPPVEDRLAVIAAQMNALAVDNARDNNSLDSDAPEADTIPDPHNIVLEDKLLAIGGRADVFRATWTKDGNPNDKIQVAVKILRLSGMSRDVPDDYDAQLAKLDQRLGRESFTWKNLKHDHITPFLGYLKSRNDVIPGDNPILVSPYYANGNLVNYLRSNPNADVFALLEQAAEGLLYLHTRKPRVAHLDIKGENILINDDHKASLCDFGIARILDNIASGFYTTTNQAMTLPFASPEMQLGKRVDTAADVYSFAGLILQALSGIHPYWEIRAAPAMITLNICMGVFPEQQHYPMPKLPKAVSDDLWKLLKRCWVVKASDRPTMQDVLTELRRLHSLVDAPAA